MPARRLSRHAVTIPCSYELIYNACIPHISISIVHSTCSNRGVMSYLTDEISSQPDCWSQAIETVGSAGAALPGPGERVAAIGCGSSLNVAHCYAALR